MSYDPEIEAFLSELWQKDEGETASADSLQKTTNYIDRFFENLNIPIRTGCGIYSTETTRFLGEGADSDSLVELRNFIKSEKQKVPRMSRRELLTSLGVLGNVLQKVAATASGSF